MNHFIPCPTTKDRTVPVGPVPGSANIMISMSSEQLVIIQVVNGRRQGRRMPERGTQSFRSARDSALRHSGQKVTEALDDRWIVVQSAEALGWGTAWIFRLSHEIILDEANITSLFWSPLAFSESSNRAQEDVTGKEWQAHRELVRIAAVKNVISLLHETACT